MTDFGAWFARQGAKKMADDPGDEAAYADLGIWKRDGAWMINCRVCAREFELYVHPSEYGENDNCCGGSPRCCP